MSIPPTPSRMSGLRIIVATVLVLPVSIVMLAATTVARALIVGHRVFAYVGNCGSALLGALLREIDRPS